MQLLIDTFTLYIDVFCVVHWRDQISQNVPLMG